jgi:hypothetical protein
MRATCRDSLPRRARSSIPGVGRRRGWQDARVASKVGVPIAVAGVVVAVGVVLGGIFVFAGDESESGGGQAAGPAPVTRLSLPESDPSGTEPVPDDPYPPVPSEQVDGDLVGMPRTGGRNVYIPVQDNDCSRQQVWPRGEHADRVEVEIRTLPVELPTGITTDAEGNGSYGCLGSAHGDGHAVIELAEPLGDRRLVVTYHFDPLPT